MIFRNEKIMGKIYLIRGYEKESDNSYCMVMLLVGNNQNKYEVKGFLSQKTLSVGDSRSLYRYLKSLGLELYANVLKTDFKRFYEKRKFRTIEIIGKKCQ